MDTIEHLRDLISRVGQSGLGSHTEVTLLRLAARDPHVLDDALFAAAFELAIADEYAELDASLLGNQARAYSLRVLSQEALSAPVFGQVCRFLAHASPDGQPPPQALPLLLQRLPHAIEQARSHPGEEWEDRNWGGYNATAEENTAEVMSEAIVSLCKGDYSKGDWRLLIEALLELPDVDLRRVEMAAAGVEHFKYFNKNVFAVLRKNLLRRGPEVKRALGHTSPVEALRAVQALISAL